MISDAQTDAACNGRSPPTPPCPVSDKKKKLLTQAAKKLPASIKEKETHWPKEP